MIVLRSILHNLAVVAVGFVVALIGVTLDGLFAIGEFRSIFGSVFGSLFICIGFLATLGDIFVLQEQHESHRHGSAENAADIRPFPLFAQSPLSRRERTHFLRSRPSARIARSACDDRASSSVH